MEPDDLTALQKAVQSLEYPSLAARITNLVGKPVELIGLALPHGLCTVDAVRPKDEVREALGRSPD